MRLNQITEGIRRFGVAKAVQDLALRAARRVCDFRILKCVTLAAVDSEATVCDRPYQGRFVGEQELIALVRDHPEYEMTEKFVREAFAKGDECYAFVDGEVLATYGWYANTPTAIDAPGMLLHFDPRYVYMYKGFTHENYRGQRLHAIAMARALREYCARGYQGLVSYVEWNNFSSLKSCYRIGYTDFGLIYLAKFFGRHVSYAGRGCSNYRVCLKQALTPYTATPAVRAAQR